jgi:hypothetical protein
MMRVAMMTGVEMGKRGPHVRVAMIEIKNANTGAKYHFGETVGDDVRYASAVTMIV